MLFCILAGPPQGGYKQVTTFRREREFTISGKKDKAERVCRILVVDDNEGIRELLQTLFDDEGYDITVAAGGEEMRAALTSEPFDLALVDVTLPRGEDGFSLAAAAHAAGCAVILVTGDTRHFETIEASGYPFLLKPFRIERLLALVTEVLDQRDACIPDSRRRRS